MAIPDLPGCLACGKDELARERGVDFSLVLQEALKERLRVSSGRRRTK